ncbi:bile acid:sodium symporter family protein [Corynebacterium doosanense]|uniref:Bile acid:sodium symporter n=1 Tax=Corynebacterium doosanense CAU 212 = DSM 45436 TaxID=558173 RepID=A0A097IFL1_9CORY|nr:bile acid:sodium symporter family protein [Corynebacterium doosanense]AIT60900.1 Bile acid:sodium symporter [Corynebacterium doosanense CAU 212 = DSM 45436]
MSSPSVSDAQDRSALLATLGFPLLVILGGVIGFALPDVTSQGASAVNPLLGIIMFGMGLTLKPADFRLVFTRPLPVVIGVIAQYLIMPLTAVLVVWLLRLPPEIAAGVILVGCAPGGTSSNVVSYLARGDVALSVTMTSVSTLLAPVITPLLVALLAGEYMPVQAGPMALSIVQVVLVPVILGLLVSTFLPRVVEAVTPVLPWISVIAISSIVAIVVGGSHERILEAGVLVLGAVILHNLLGYLLGYGVGAVFGQPVPVKRTMAIEVGMQNSGLAAGLAATYMSPLAALPAAVFSVWHNLSGALLAALCRLQDARR